MRSSTSMIRGLPQRGTVRDVALVAVALTGTLVLLAYGGVDAMRPGSHLDTGGTRDLDPLGVVLAAASTVPLLVWRRSPSPVFVVTGGASVVLAGLGYSLDVTPGAAAALYLLTASREPKTSWSRRTGLVVVGLFAAYLAAAAIGQSGFPRSELVHSTLAWAVAWFAGERTRLRRLHIAELTERARRSERDAEQDRQLAAAEERARIARDLHDAAGHAISVIAVRAGAARLRHYEDPDRSLHALEAIEQLARQTAEEIDHIVTGLRRATAPTGTVEAPTGLASLDTLIGEHSAAGLDVTLDTTGSPAHLAGATDQAAYRILQEALTNAARHGAGSATVNLAYTDGAVELTVTNPVTTDDGHRSGGGHGLVGMRERAKLLGGRLEAERVNGTFRLRAHLPDRGSRR